MGQHIPPEWGLGLKELTEIYAVEVALANQLRQASNVERKKMYGSVYQEYFKRLPFHPQLTIKKGNGIKSSRVNFQLLQVLPHLNKDKNFMEVGAGDCSLSIAAASYCDKVYALEVSSEVANNSSFPANMQLLFFDGFNIPLQDETIDLAYSNQLMEHLHPDDAEEQLRSIFRVLKKKGVYVCITPNRISGPHDISRFFTDHPVGFHLREYSAVDLRNLFLKAGFSKVVAYAIIKGRKVGFPFFFVRLIEWIAERMSVKFRNDFLKVRLVSIVFNSIIAAVK